MGARHERHRETTGYVGAPLKRREDDPLLRGRGTFVDNIDLPGTVVMVVVRSPYAHARMKTSIDTRRAKARGRRRRVHRRRPARRLEGGDAVRLAGDRGHEEPGALPARRRGALPGRRRRGRDRRHARARDRRGGARRGRLRAARRARRRRGRSQDGAALVHAELGTNESYVWKLETDATVRRSRTPTSIVKRRYCQPPLIPNAIEPRGVVAVPGPDGRRDAVVGDPDPAHPAAAHRRRRSGMSETKLRVIAPDVGGGFGSKLDVYAEELLAVALARRLGRPVKWMEERSENYVATIHGRDFVTEYTLAATKDGKITAIRANVNAAMGAYLQLVTPGIPLLGAWIYAGPVRDPELQRHVHGRVHEHDADRRLPRRRPARGDLRDRADDGPARARARDGPARAAAQELHLGVPGHARLRADDRHRRLPRLARQAPRAPRPRRAPGGAGDAARQRERRSRSASASRRTTRCAASRRRASSARSATRPAAGSRRRSAACRPARSRSSPAPRRTARATRRRGRRSSPTSSAATSTRSRCCTATRPSRTRARHVREPEPPGRRRRR